ncbi:MAG TPA: hypothetical protein VGQ26_15130 [Streptosporangiaceae bacterium]|jgi:hypothetical protein|nr:hypothetical protein [Streptosporangiaceae bacterium]
MPSAKQDEAAHPQEQIREWFATQLPDEWFEGAPKIVIDREEITIIGHLPRPAAAAATAGEGTARAASSAATATEGTAEPSGADAEAAAIGRSRRFREETRDTRIEIAREAEHAFRRKVSWGVICDDRKVMFTTLSIPVMTRLRQSERRVLDTLVDAGVARSRSDALAWCVRLVGEHEDSWLSDLREALRHVEQVRAGGPRA